MYWSIGDAARRLSLSRGEVLRLCASGELEWAWGEGAKGIRPAGLACLLQVPESEVGAWCLLPSHDAARRLGVSRSELHRRIERKEAVSVQLGRHRRIRVPIDQEGRSDL